MDSSVSHVVSVDNWWLITSVMKPADPGSPPALPHTWCEPNTPPFVYMQRQTPANCCVTCYLMLPRRAESPAVFMYSSHRKHFHSANTRLSDTSQAAGAHQSFCLSCFKRVVWKHFKLNYFHLHPPCWGNMTSSLMWGKVWFHLIPWRTGWLGFWTGLCVLICTFSLV